MRFVSGVFARCDFRVVSAPYIPGICRQLQCTYLAGHARRQYSFLSNSRRLGVRGLWSYHSDRGCLRKTSTLTQQNEPTIFALSTAPGRAAIAIIRISGPACLDIYRGLCPGRPDPNPRYASLRTLYRPRSSSLQILDAGALVIFFPAPNTATGEDVLEFHVHGGPATVKAVLSAIPTVSTASSADIRYAEPGEFTKRAFYNDRLDLTQVEALSDTLSAETEQQRRLAVRGSTSSMAKVYEEWRQQLLYARGELEALIDFSEDQAFEESPAHLCLSVARQIDILRSYVDLCIQSASRGELLRDGINIALVGAPNAGKSSLLNCIVGREAAIVSDQAGTTRDVIEATMDIEGYLCRFGDLAGIRSKAEITADNAHANKIEIEGIRRAQDRAAKADVIIAFLSVKDVQHPQLTDVCLGSEVEATLKTLDPGTQRVVCVLNKADLFDGEVDVNTVCQHFLQSSALRRFDLTSIIPISCKEDGQQIRDNGIRQLLQALKDVFQDISGSKASDNVPKTSNNEAWTTSIGATQRQRNLLEECLAHLTEFRQHVQVDSDPDAALAADISEDKLDVVLGAESLRSAANCLARITGRGEAGDVEEVLGVVFEKFCVGK